MRRLLPLAFAVVTACAHSTPREEKPQAAQAGQPTPAEVAELQPGPGEKLSEIDVNRDGKADVWKITREVDGKEVLVRKYSDLNPGYPRGDTGFFDRGGKPVGLPSPLVEAAFSIPSNGIVLDRVVETADGWSRRLTTRLRADQDGLVGLQQGNLQPDRLQHPAGELAIVLLQHVGTAEIEIEALLEPVCEKGETSRDHTHLHPTTMQSRHHLFRTGIGGEAFIINPLQHPFIEPIQGSHTLGQ